MRTIAWTAALTLAALSHAHADSIRAAAAAERIQPALHHIASEIGGEATLPQDPVAAPGGQAVHAPSQPASKYIDRLFFLREMEFVVEGQPAGVPLVLEAGKSYKLSFENHGQVLHEVLFGRGLVHEDDGLGYGEHLFRDVSLNVWGRVCATKERQEPWRCGSKGDAKLIYGVKTFGLRELELDPGMRLSIYVEIPASKRGTWEIGCFAPGHHQAGMRIPIVIQ